MKIHKPAYNATDKVYTCKLSDGFRLSIQKDKEDAVSAPAITDTFLDPLTQTLIDSTNGWFSKPITTQWLRSRIVIHTPLEEIPTDFDGTIEFVAKHLTLTKDEFRFHCVILKITPAEKVVIVFDEPEKVEVVESSIPEASVESNEPLGIGPTRRILHKARVMKERAKAARALFRAERLTQEYIQLYSAEGTDWEDDDDEQE